MNKAKFKNILKESLFPLGIFLFVVILLAVIFSINGFALFNREGYTVISLDMQSQYIAYLRSFKSMLDKDGIVEVYTSQKIFGGDFLSIYTYYLASPFNYLLKFVSYADIPLFLIWTNIIKMALAGVFMYALLRYTFKKVSYGSIGFAVSYALVSYAFIYSSNFMWLDAVMILPIIILGLKMIEDKHNPIPYIVGLTYALFSGWYIGAMVVIFTTIFFVALLVAHPKGEKLERTKFCAKFAGFSLIAGISSAANWLVAFSHLGGTKATSQIPVMKEFSFSMFFAGMLENGYTSPDNIKINSGYMPLFISIAVIALAVMFFFNRGYTLRRRFSYLGVVLVYLIFSMYTNLNALMHGGREPTWFPARYAFVISFFFCYLGALQFDKREETPIWGLLSPLGAMAVILPIVLNIENTFLNKRTGISRYYTLSIVSLIIYIAVTLLFVFEYYLRYKRVNYKYQSHAFAIVFSILAVISAYRGGDVIVRRNAKTNEYQKYSTYLNDDSYTKYMQFDDENAYRSTVMFNRPGNYNSIDNNPMFYGFDGMSNYSSSSKTEVDSYMSKIGFHYNGYFANYSYGSTASMNSLLGIKYFLDDTKRSGTYNPKPIFVSSSPFAKEVLNPEGNIVKYTNELATSLAFTTAKVDYQNIAEYIPVEGKTNYKHLNHFEYQNQIFKTLTGLDKDIFTPLNVINTTLDEGVEITSEDEYGIRRYSWNGTSEGSKGITVSFSYDGVIDEDHNFYFGEMDQLDAYYTIDGYSIGESNYWRKGVRGFTIKNNVTKKLRLRFKDKTGNNREVVPSLYVEDINVLKEHIALLNKNDIRLTKYHSHNESGYTGSINIVNKENKDLLFTLPNEKEIHVYIDGREVNKLTRWNIFTSVDISSYQEGNHSMKIVYKDKVYALTSVISPIVFISSIGISFSYYFLKWIFKKEESEK